MTHTEKADYLHIHQTIYSDYKLGWLSIPISVLIKIADFFETSLDYLVGQSDGR